MPRRGIARRPVRTFSNAVVIYDNVNAINDAIHSAAELFRSFIGTNVANNFMSGTTARANRSKRFVAGSGVQPVHQDSRSLCRKDSGNTRASSSPRTRDESDPTLETEIHSRWN
jgi:hypothetical protein